MKSKHKFITILGLILLLMILAGCLQNYSLSNTTPKICIENNEINNFEADLEHPIKELPKTSIKEEWRREWAYGQSGNWGKDIVIDTSDNVYIMGMVEHPITCKALIAIVKYNSEGVYQWNITWTRYGGSISADDIAIDNDGNLYVTGSFYNASSSNSEILLIKFNSNGIFQWEAFWNTNMDDYGHGIALDSNNNIYIAGEITHSSYYTPGKNFTVVKFDSSGIYLWNYTIGSGSESDGGFGIKVDDSDDIYVCGYTETYADEDFLVLKLNSNGDQIWNATFGYGWWDIAYNIDIDSNHNVFVAGRLNDETVPPAICIVKFNSTGHYKWNYTHEFGITDDIKVESPNVAVDSVDDVYFTGYYITNPPYPNKNILVFKFNNTGHYYWNKTYDYSNPGYPSNEYVYDIALDSEDNIFLGGYRTVSLYDYFLVLKIVQTPGEFTLYINCSSPSLTGSYNINWDSSDGAENYTVYEHNSYIYEVNDTIKIAEGLTTLSYNLYNKENGTYYYKVVSFNRWGNESSNCVQIEVKRAPPGAFELSSNAGSPNINGSFTLFWTVSQYAQSYSLYQNDTYISKVNDSIKIDEGLINSSYIFSDLANGTYYFKIVAFNVNGNSSSNCIQIDVKRYPPGAFTLDSDANSPDKDGCFNLNWTQSLYAANYSVYQHTSYISEFNESIRIAQGIKTLIYHLSDIPNGTYYFAVAAFNINGNSTSNCIQVIVKNLPPGPFDFYNNATDPEKNGFVRCWWNKSLDAINYKLFIAREPIDFTKSAFNLSFIDGINITYINNEYSYTLYLTKNGKWYIRLVSFNRNGNYTYPIPFEINVSLAPKPLTLTSNADLPSDSDGCFKLSWNIATEYSYFKPDISNYSLYYSAQVFTFEDIGNLAGILCLKNNITTLNYNCSGYKDGTYSFMIVVYNLIGNSSSNCLSITVQLPIVPNGGDDDDDDDGGTDDNLFFIITIGSTISGAAGAGATIILLRMRKIKRIKQLNKIVNDTQQSKKS